MKRIIFLLLMVASFFSIATPSSDIIKPMVWVALKKRSVLYISVCQSVEIKCNNDTNLWKEKGAEDNFYLTGSSPQLIKIEKKHNQYVKTGLWDFSTKSNNDAGPDDELTRGQVYIYPAFYPLNKSKLAVAIVSKWSTAYSGGRREAEYADFMMLNNDGSYQTAFKNILFSSREMIRACFSEADYAKNSHCDDENWSILNLKFIDKGKEYYSWKFIEKSYNWPAFTGKSSISIKTNESIAYPFQKVSKSES